MGRMLDQPFFQGSHITESQVCQDVLDIERTELGVRSNEKSTRLPWAWWYISGYLWKRIADEIARMHKGGFLEALQEKWFQED